MKLEVDKVIELASGKKYLVIETVNNNNVDYYYIAELNKEEDDIIENYKIVCVVEESGYHAIKEITDEEELKVLLPLFIDKFPKDDN